jgi:glutathione S-transferase
VRVTYTVDYDDQARRAIVAYFEKHYGDKLRRKDGLANRADVLRFLGEAVDDKWMAAEDELNQLNADLGRRGGDDDA